MGDLESDRDSSDHFGRSVDEDIFSRSSSLPYLVANSVYGQVIFHDIYDSYPTDCDLYFRYTLTDAVVPKHGDRIGLYQVGWKHISEYRCCVPAPLPMQEKQYQSLTVLRSSIPQSSMPKDEDELFQLCYVTVDNKIVGASAPFTVRRPHERDLCSVEDKYNNGLIVYKSRIAVLHDKIAIVDEAREEAELKVFTLTNKISIIEKELASVTSTNKDLTVSLENAKEDVNLLTENLKRVKDEFVQSQVEFEHLNNEHIQLQKKLKESEIVFKEMELKCEKLNASLNNKEQELQNAKMELNNVKQEQIHAELTLKEVSHYNARLKKDLDVLMLEKESLIETEKTLRKEVDQMGEKQKGSQLLQQQQQQQLSELTQKQQLQEQAFQQQLELLQQEQQQLLMQNQQQMSNHVALQQNGALSPHMNADNCNVEELRAQLDGALQLLDETLQNQPAANEANNRRVCELETRISQLTEEHVKLTEENDALKNTAAKQYEEIRNMSDELIQLKSMKENLLQKEAQYVDEIETLANSKAAALDFNETITSRLHCLEDELQTKKNEYENEISTLKNKISELQKPSKDSTKLEELETVVRCLKAALMTKPSLEEFCQIIFESTRVTAMDSYKDLYDSVQFLDFENAEIGLKVRRLLDEFAVLKQDLDRCRLENQTVYKERDQIKNDLIKITEENEFHKRRIVELNETVNEISNCLYAVRKENNELQQLKETVRKESSEPQQVKELKEELEKVKAKKDELEKQLKEAKIASALTNIGRVTVDESSLMAEVEQLRSKIRELETQHSSPGNQKCCLKMQEQLKRSAKEYAKLYHQLETEREYYQKLLSLNCSQRPPTSVVPVAATSSGLSTTESS